MTIVTVRRRCWRMAVFYHAGGRHGTFFTKFHKKWIQRDSPETELSMTDQWHIDLMQGDLINRQGEARLHRLGNHLIVTRRQPGEIEDGEFTF